MRKKKDTHSFDFRPMVDVLEKLLNENNHKN